MTTTKENIIADIIHLLENDEELFDSIIEELDSYNGYLGDNRYYCMDDFDEAFCHYRPTELAGRIAYGDFNPAHDYFCINAYGNLESSNWKDYTDFLDEYLIEELLANRESLCEIDTNLCLSDLLDELEEIEGIA